jgi:6-phospho-beta-glucosidase
LLPYQTTEQTCRISKNGAYAIPLDNPMPLHMLAIVQTLKAYESLTVAAALENDYDKARNALLIHPLCGPEKAKVVLDDIFRTFESYLLPYGWEGKLKRF